MDFPEIHSYYLVPIRYRSKNNPWIDFLVITSEDCAPQVKNSMFKAIDAYYQGDFDEYPDAVEHYLGDVECVPFAVMYRDGENFSANYMKEWNKTLDTIEVITGRKIESASLF